MPPDAAASHLDFARFTGTQTRRRASSRPGPAAVPHPTSPPRLIPPTRHPAPPQCHIPVGPTATSHPGSALHWHPGPGPPPHLIPTVLPALHRASSRPASRPPPRLVPTPRFTGTQARLASAPASPQPQRRLSPSLASAPASPQPQPRPPVAQTQSLWA
jgi:hypothetical protein